MLILIVFVACSATKNNYTANSAQDDGYTVYRIDSVKTVYFIYAKDKSNEVYKILSSRDNTAKGEAIQINHVYSFMLETFWTKKDDLVTGTYFHGVPVAVEGSERSLYIAHNISGLKFIR
jgi:hypothetical protein